MFIEMVNLLSMIIKLKDVVIKLKDLVILIIIREGVIAVKQQR